MLLVTYNFKEPEIQTMLRLNPFNAPKGVYLNYLLNIQPFVQTRIIIAEENPTGLSNLDWLAEILKKKRQENYQLISAVHKKQPLDPEITIPCVLESRVFTGEEVENIVTKVFRMGNLEYFQLIQKSASVSDDVRLPQLQRAQILVNAEQTLSVAEQIGKYKKESDEYLAEIQNLLQENDQLKDQLRFKDKLLSEKQQLLEKHMRENLQL